MSSRGAWHRYSTDHDSLESLDGCRAWCASDPECNRPRTGGADSFSYVSGNGKLACPSGAPPQLPLPLPLAGTETMGDCSERSSDSDYTSYGGAPASADHTPSWPPPCFFLNDVFSSKPPT